MFVHVVLLRLSPAADAEFHARVAAFAQRVRAECAGVLHFACLPNEAARSAGYTHATYGVFSDRAAHDAYQAHPAHEAMKAFMEPYINTLVVFDATL